MGAPYGNKNAAGGRGEKKTIHGKVGSKKWEKALNAQSKRKSTGAKNLPGSKRGRRSY